MLILPSTNTSLQLNTSSTASIDYYTAWMDHSSVNSTITGGTLSSTDGNIAAIARTTIMPAPAANNFRHLRLLMITNRGATSNDIRLELVNGATTVFLTPSLTLDASESLEIIGDGSIRVYDAEGLVKESAIGATISDTAYAASWNGVSTVAPSKNAVYDVIFGLSGELVDTSSLLITDARLADMPAWSVKVRNAGSTGVPSNGQDSDFAFRNGVLSSQDLVLGFSATGELYVFATSSLSGAGGAPSDTVFDSAWDGDTTVAPSKNAVYDALQPLSGNIISDTAYGASWNGVTTIAPSKNAVYDKIETLSAIATSPTTTSGDMIYYYLSADARLPIGSEGQVLITSGVYPVWANISGLAIYDLSATDTISENDVFDMIVKSDLTDGLSGTSRQVSALAMGLRKHQFSATTAPTQYDDNATSGYQVGSFVVVGVSGQAYMCLDDTSGAAVWSGVVSGGSGAASPTTTQGDIIYYESTADTRLPLGTSGQILEVSDSQPVWKEPQWRRVWKTADEDRTNSTLANDAELYLSSLNADTTYLLRGIIYYKMADAAADIKIQFDYTGSLSGDIVTYAESNTCNNTTQTFAMQNSMLTSKTLFSTVSGAARTYFENLLTTSGGGGEDWVLSWAQNTTNASATTILKGSYFEYTTIPTS